MDLGIARRGLGDRSQTQSSQGMLGGRRVIHLPPCLSTPLSSVEQTELMSRARLSADTGQNWLMNVCLPLHLAHIAKAQSVEWALAVFTRVYPPCLFQ